MKKKVFLGIVLAALLVVGVTTKVIVTDPPFGINFQIMNLK